MVLSARCQRFLENCWEEFGSAAEAGRDGASAPGPANSCSAPCRCFRLVLVLLASFRDRDAKDHYVALIHVAHCRAWPRAKTTPPLYSTWPYRPAWLGMANPHLERGPVLMSAARVAGQVFTGLTSTNPIG